MMRRCMDCQRFDLRYSPLGTVGFGNCAVKSLTKGHTFSAVYPRDCATFAPAEPATIAKRDKVLTAAGILTTPARTTE